MNAKINTRKSNAGTLYLTIAPRIGVMRPINAYMQITKKRLKQNSCMLLSFLNREKMMQKIPIARMKRFSTAAMRTNGEEESHEVGRISTRRTAPGELRMRLAGVGSISGIVMTLRA